MPDYNCPCCGAPLTERAPAEALKYASVPGIAGKALSALVAAYPRGIARRTLSDIVYAEDPDGGPDQPENTIASSLSQYRHELARFGWRVAATDYGTVALLPIGGETAN